MTLQTMKVNLANRCYLYLMMGTDATSCFALLGCLECWKLSFCSRITGPVHIRSEMIRNDPIEEMQGKISLHFWTN